MLSRFFELVKTYVRTYQSDIILALAVIFITATAYNVGKIVAFNSLKTPIAITNPNEVGNIARHDEILLSESPNPKKTDLSVVASSKSSGKLYHFKWCPGAGQISSANLLTFPTETAAIAAGYKLASNCKR